MIENRSLFMRFNDNDYDDEDDNDDERVELDSDKKIISKSRCNEYI
jgi:hypothetical protein